MLSGDSMFPRIGDATQRAQLEARTLGLLAAGIRTALITALIGPALIAWLTAPTIGLAAAIGPAALLYLITACCSRAAWRATWLLRAVPARGPG